MDIGGYIIGFVKWINYSSNSSILENLQSSPSSRSAATKQKLFEPSASSLSTSFSYPEPKHEIDVKNNLYDILNDDF